MTKGGGAGAGRTESRGEHEAEYEPDDDDAPPPEEGGAPADDRVREQNLAPSRASGRNASIREGRDKVTLTFKVSVAVPAHCAIE